MQGTRLPGTRIGCFPTTYEELLATPGAYWKVLHRSEDRPLDVREHPEDRRWWGEPNDPRFESNLTGGVWGIVTPDGRYGMLSVHTVREHEDGTISVRPGDGSSNSILVAGGPEGGQWHGYIEHGVWSSC